MELVKTDKRAESLLRRKFVSLSSSFAMSVKRASPLMLVYNSRKKTSSTGCLCPISLQIFCGRKINTYPRFPLPYQDISPINRRTRAVLARRLSA